MRSFNRLRSFKRYLFENFLIRNSFIEFPEIPITLAQERASPWYAGLRSLSGRYDTLDLMTDYVLSFIYNNKKIGDDFDYVVGVPAGATVLAVATTMKHHFIKRNRNGKIVFVRESEKALHGKPSDRDFVGPVERGDKVVLLEDVVTTGNSLIEIGQLLEDNGVETLADVVLLNRMERFSYEDERNIADILKENGEHLYAMTTARTLLPKAVRALKPSPNVVGSLGAYYEEYGSVKIKFTSSLP